MSFLVKLTGAGGSSGSSDNAPGVVQNVVRRTPARSFGVLTGLSTIGGQEPAPTHVHLHVGKTFAEEDEPAKGPDLATDQSTTDLRADEDALPMKIMST